MIQQRFIYLFIFLLVFHSWTLQAGVTIKQYDGEAQDSIEEPDYEDSKYDGQTPSGYYGGAYDQANMGSGFGGGMNGDFNPPPTMSAEEWEANLGHGNDEFWNSYNRAEGVAPQELVLNNPFIGEGVKAVLKADKTGLEMKYHAAALNMACQQVHQFKVIDFYNKEINQKLIKKRPAVCGMFLSPKKISSTYGGDLVEYSIDPKKLQSFKKEQKNFQGKMAEVILSESKKVNKNKITFSQEEGLSYGFGPAREIEKLKLPMLQRLWLKMGKKEQLNAMYSCREMSVTMNHLKTFWKVNDKISRNGVRSRPGPSKEFGHFKKICQENDIKKLMPYMDESILAEIVLARKINKKEMAPTLARLCHNWPEAELKDSFQIPIPPKEHLYLSLSESRRTGHYSNISDAQGGIDLFNKDQDKLSKRDREALGDYTSGNYNAMNAYAMWGNAGLYILQWKKARDKKKSEFLPDGNISEQTRKKQAEQIEKARTFARNNAGKTEDGKKKKADPHGVWYTGHNYETGEQVEVLDKAMKKMQPFKGITFGAHSLSGHVFKGLRVGSTFSPDFFMSTSTSRETAINFLKTNKERDDVYYSKTKEEKKRENERFNKRVKEIGEDKAYEEAEEARKDRSPQFLFVIKSKSGIPVKNQSSFRSENEVLFSPSSKFRVLAKEKYFDPNTDKYLDHVNVVYLEDISYRPPQKHGNRGARK